MSGPIKDVESMQPEPPSFEELFEGDGEEDKLEVTIVHEDGSDVVTDFAKIEEIGIEQSTIRVYYGDSTVTYRHATITEVRP